MKVAGLRHVGRGKTRIYQADAVLWCAILDTLADRGLPVHEMNSAVKKLRAARKVKKTSRGTNPFKAALDGVRPVFAVFHEERVATGEIRIRECRIETYHEGDWPVEIPVGCASGFWLDLTAIFARVRR